MKIFDLNVPLEKSPSEPLPVGVEHQSHQASAQFMASFFGATVADLPHGYGWANDSVTMNAHSGTHVDAPWHYYPTCADQPARTIDQMPLEWFYGDGVVLDNLTFTTPVPEPETYALMLAGLGAVGLVARRRRRG